MIVNTNHFSQHLVSRDPVEINLLHVLNTVPCQIPLHLIVFITQEFVTVMLYVTTVLPIDADFIW